MDGKRWFLALGLAALATTGCVFDAGDGGRDVIRPADVPADGDDLPLTCSGLPDCDQVLAGCGAGSEGLCFPCCAWDWDGQHVDQACCAGQDAFQDVKPDAAVDVGPSDLPGEFWAVDVVPDVAVDVAADAPPDVFPDCGQTTCYDCECDCGDGTYVPYGGCFDDCNTVPPTVRDCSANCDGMCGSLPPKECFSPGIPGDCPEGEACVQRPCPKCGTPPESFCLQAPCEPLGCWLDDHCDGGQQCYGEDFLAPKMGYCAAPPAAAGDCWTDAECPQDARCDGAMHCPPCAICDAVEKTGRCVATEGNEHVLLWVPDTLVLPREQFTPTWFNFTKADVFLPGCSTFTMEQQDPDTGAWIDKGDPVMCGWEGIAVRLQPGDAHETLLLTAPDLAGGQGQQRWRLHGKYWTGCLPDKPLSAAQCSGGPFDVYSFEYAVMIPM